MSRGVSIKEVEEFPRRIKLFLIVIVVIFLIGTFGFKFIHNISFQEAILLTLESLALLYTEETVLGRYLQIFLAIVGVFLVWWVLWGTADMVADGNLSKYLKLRYYTYKINKMKSHFIIVGGGRFGEEVAKVLVKDKFKPVIIEKEELVVLKLRKKGFVTLHGDATNEELLKKAGIEKAKRIILALPNTEKNILLTITAKELNPKIEVYSRADNSSIASKLKKAGAKIVIVPEVLAADKLAKDLELK